MVKQVTTCNARLVKAQGYQKLKLTTVNELSGNCICIEYQKVVS